MVIAPEQTAVETAAGQGFAFVGRERETGLLLAALRHPPAVVLIEGEAGIGKSRLMHEATAAIAAANGRVLTGFCHPLREPLPYGPVLDALRKVGAWLPPAAAIPASAGALARLLPDLAPRLPAPPERPPNAHTERFQLVDGLRALLSALGPVVLVVEDAHWLDEATREMLLLLTRDMPAPLSLVLTFRAEDLPAGASVLGAACRRRPGTSGASIHLDPLSEKAVHDLARDALGEHATARLGSVLYERSEGLPLVAEEDLITLAEHGHRDQGLPLVAEEDLITLAEHGHRHTWRTTADMVADLEHAEVPRGLREAFTERLAALPPDAAAVVEAAAVLDVPATEPLLAEVAGLDAERASLGLTEALRSAVLRESDTALYAFRHVLAQQVAYRQMPGPRRSRLHRRAITVLESREPEPLVQIAHHTMQLGDPAAWLERAEAAADQAIALGDEGTAAALLHGILGQRDVSAEVRSRAALTLAGIAVNGIDYGTDAAALRRILADPQLPTAVRGDIRLSMGLLMVNHAADRAGFQEIARAAGELADRPERAARALVALAMDERDGGPEQARIWLERAEAQARLSGDEAMRAAVRATRLTLQARDGEPEVWALTDRLPRAAEDDAILRQTARALFNTGELAIELGHDRRAARMLAEAHDLARRVNFPRVESYSRISLLRLGFLGGDWDGVEERFRELCREYPDIALASTEEAIVVGRLSAAHGKRTRAAALLTEAVAFGESEAQVTVTLRAAARLAEVRLAEDPASRDAWAVAAPAVTTLRRAGAWARAAGLVPIGVEAALAAGERRAAERLVADAEDGLVGRDAPGALAELHVARGILAAGAEPADPATAAEWFELALRAWSEIGRPYECARVTERLGRALAAAGDEEASARLDEAIAGYEALGASGDCARCQHAARDLGLAKPSPRGRRGYGDKLSPREQQVAELVARGATNRDIANTLFLSPRTVEQHVARLLKKLDTTRAGVREALADLPGRSGRQNPARNSAQVPRIRSRSVPQSGHRGQRPGQTV